MRTISILCAGFFMTVLLSSLVHAQDKKVDLFPKDSRSESQKTMDRNMRDAAQTHERLQQEKTREDMRDKTHDGIGRVRPNESTSYGAYSKDGVTGVDIKKTTP